MGEDNFIDKYSGLYHCYTKIDIYPSNMLFELVNSVYEGNISSLTQKQIMDNTFSCTLLCLINLNLISDTLTWSNYGI